MKIPLSKPEMTKEMIDAAVHALQNEKLVMGESVFKFEEEFARYIGTEFAVSFNSGSAALEVALSVLIGKDYKVITTPNSFVATANCIVLNGGTPVFVDIDEKDGNIDVNKIKVSGEKGILPVHLYGNPCDMKTIMGIAEDNDMFVVEDACQAHGAEIDGKKVGSLGTVGCFSFYSIKNMTVGGDGGIVTTNDEKIREKIASIRDAGRKSKYEHDILGSTKRLNTVNAAIGRVQLKYLDRWNEWRRKLADLYSKLLPNDVQIEYERFGKCVFHLFVIKVSDRDNLVKHLEMNGIDSGVHYPISINKQPLYLKKLGFNVQMPVAEGFAEHIVSLPMFPSLTEDEVKIISEKINEVI